MLSRLGWSGLEQGCAAGAGAIHIRVRPHPTPCSACTTRCSPAWRPALLPHVLAPRAHAPTIPCLPPALARSPPRPPHSHTAGGGTGQSFRSPARQWCDGVNVFGSRPALRWISRQARGRRAAGARTQQQERGGHRCRRGACRCVLPTPAACRARSPAKPPAATSKQNPSKPRSCCQDCAGMVQQPELGGRAAQHLCQPPPPHGAKHT